MGEWSGLPPQGHVLVLQDVTFPGSVTLQADTCHQ